MFSSNHNKVSHNHKCKTHLFSCDLVLSKETEKHNLHTQIHTELLCHPLHIPPSDLESGGEWKTGPCKPTGCVDYHFNGLAR